MTDKNLDLKFLCQLECLNEAIAYIQAFRLRVCTQKTIFLFLNQNICCGY